MTITRAKDALDPLDALAMASRTSGWWFFYSHDTRGERERYIYIYIVKFHQSEAISFGCFCNVCLCCILTECCWTVRLVLEDFSLWISNDWG